MRITSSYGAVASSACAVVILSSARLAVCPSGLFGASATTCCQTAAAASMVLLPERQDDAPVEQGLRVGGVESERVLELLQGAIGLPGVVVAHG